MSLLVTGGCGFVGTNVAEAALAAGERVVLFDRIGLCDAAQAALRKLGGGFTVMVADITDRRAVQAAIRDHDVRRVIHAAVITSDAHREQREPGTIVEVNVGGTLNVLGAARDAGCERFVYVGSGQAYGATHDQGEALEEERSPSRPQDLYGITKFAAEQATLRLGSLWHFDSVAVRLGSVFGPWELDTGVRDMLSPYLRTAQLALGAKPAILPASEPWRDWIYSRDVADGLLRLARAPSLGHRVYHLSSGLDWSGGFVQWCSMLCDAYDRFSYKVAAPAEAANVSFVVQRDRSPMDIKRIGRDTGFAPRFGPPAAYTDYIAWLRSHRGAVPSAV